MTRKDFDFIKLIGTGGYSKVYCAKLKVENKNDEKDLIEVRSHSTSNTGNGLKKYFAVKEIKKSFLLEQEIFLKRIRNENKLLKILNYPFIINSNFSIETDEYIYLGFEYHNGGELFYHLKTNKLFNEECVKFISVQMYLALLHLHTKRIIYR